VPEEATGAAKAEGRDAATTTRTPLCSLRRFFSPVSEQMELERLRLPKRPSAGLAARGPGPWRSSEDDDDEALMRLGLWAAARPTGEPSPAESTSTSDEAPEAKKTELVGRSVTKMCLDRDLKPGRRQKSESWSCGKGWPITMDSLKYR
jgi:hypothetical protein